ncbi:MAG: trypsin-like peptidase domain-containing protein [Ruminococcus sp.]|nr:trypsin-like peptidase domain-containing protein [Ruminococcus sp.]
MAEYENNNLGNEVNPTGETNTGNPAQGSPVQGNPTPGNPTPGGSDPYAYQNGYYRNTAPHQDESVYSGDGAQPTPNPQQPKSDNGSYTYVNYYSNPNDPKPNDSGKKPKKKHTGLKVVAIILAMVVVFGASIGIYEGVRTSLEAEDTVLSNSSDSTSDTADVETDEDASSDSSTSSGESWIQLASTNGSLSVTEIVEKVAPSVVGVTATYTAAATSDNSYGSFFGYGYDNGNNGTTEATSVGTGIIMSEDGYIITNAHVIYDDEYGYGEATAVQVQMSDEETTYDAVITAYDQEADLAMLKIEADGLTAAEFGDSSNCQVGEMVVAIGNPLGLEFQNTVTCGIISALNRKVTINDNTMTLIQTDTAINSGNSGGPLINSSGQVIGINSAKMSSSYSTSSASIEGIGFAIPMTEAKEIIDDLINYGYVTGRPQLGITCQDVSEAVSQAYNIPVGVYIISVTDGGAADQAGLQAMDVITGIQGEEITTTEELNAIKNEYSAGDTVTLTVVRSGQELTIEVTLEEVQSSTD